MVQLIRETVKILSSGGLILYPTDTIWGIGCDATNPDAVAKVYRLKQREDFKSMLVLIENSNWLNEYLTEVPAIAWELLEVSVKPLTIIYPKARGLATNLIASDGSIGIRVVKHIFCQELIRAFRKPIVSTSANISENPFPKRFEEIDSEIIKGVDFVIPRDFEENTHSVPSSIIQLGQKGEIKVIRE